MSGWEPAEAMVGADPASLVASLPTSCVLSLWLLRASLTRMASWAGMEKSEDMRTWSAGDNTAESVALARR